MIMIMIMIMSRLSSENMHHAFRRVHGKNKKSADMGVLYIRTAYRLSRPTDDELRTCGIERVSVHRRLRGGVRFISVLPRSPSGKLLRRKMVDSLTFLN